MYLFARWFEWNVNRVNGHWARGGPYRKVATVQLCTSTTCFVFRLSKMRTLDRVALATGVLNAIDVPLVRILHFLRQLLDIFILPYF
jgi:hypothetical protein